MVQRRAFIRSLDCLGRGGMHKVCLSVAARNGVITSRRFAVKNHVGLRVFSSSNSNIQDLEGGAMSPFHSDAEISNRKQIIQEEEARLELHFQFRESAKKAGQRVDFAGAAIVERIPLIMPDLEPFQVDFYEHEQQQNLKKRKYYPTDSFVVSDKQKQLRRDQLWAFDVIDMGTNSRIGPLAYDTELQAEVARLKNLSHEDAETEVGKAEVREAEVREAEMREAEMRETMLRSVEIEEIEGEDVTTQMSADQREAYELFEQLEENETHDGNSSFVDIGDVFDDDQMDEATWGMQMDDPDHDDAHIGEFTPEPRISDADLANDMRSLRRRLQRRLYLIVKVNDPAVATGPVWRLPSAVRESSGEVIMKAAERSVNGPLGEMDIWFHGKCPAGYMFDEYTDAAKKERNAYGSHTLFYRAERLRGHVNVADNNQILDFAWIANDELEIFVPNHSEDRYWKSVSQFMDD